MKQLISLPALCLVACGYPPPTFVGKYSTNVHVSPGVSVPSLEYWNCIVDIFVEEFEYKTRKVRKQTVKNSQNFLQQAPLSTQPNPNGTSRLLNGYHPSGSDEFYVNYTRPRHLFSNNSLYHEWVHRLNEHVGFEDIYRYEENGIKYQLHVGEVWGRLPALQTVAFIDCELAALTRGQEASLFQYLVD